MSTDLRSASPTSRPRRGPVVIPQVDSILDEDLEQTPKIFYQDNNLPISAERSNPIGNSNLRSSENNDSSQTEPGFKTFI
jgi:hypothetical protein